MRGVRAVASREAVQEGQRGSARASQGNAAIGEGACDPVVSPPRYLTDEPPGTGILGGRPIDLHFNLKQPFDAEAALGIRPDAQPAAAEERAERRAALIRVASVERGRVSQPDPQPLRRMSTPLFCPFGLAICWIMARTYRTATSPIRSAAGAKIGIHWRVSLRELAVQSDGAVWPGRQLPLCVLSPGSRVRLHHCHVRCSGERRLA
jgi:hypothetical protein